MKRNSSRFPARYCHVFFVLFLLVEVFVQLDDFQENGYYEASVQQEISLHASSLCSVGSQSCTHTFFPSSDWYNQYGECHIAISLNDCVPSLDLPDCEIPSGDWIMGDIMVAEGATPMAHYRAQIKNGSIQIVLIEAL